MTRLRAINQKIIGLFVVNPSSGASLAHMDGIRAIAVLFVLMVHSFGHAGSPQYLITVPGIHYVFSLSGIIAYMGVGVDLFFVLSGFLLAQHWLRADYLGQPKPSLKRYFKQRVFRIVPAYYVCLFLTVILLTPGYIPIALVTGHYGRLSILSHLVFLQYAFPFSAGSFGVDAQFWTLTIEAMFYVTLPFFVRFFLRNRWMVSLPVAALLTVGWLVLCRNTITPLVHLYQNYFSLSYTPQAAVRYIMSYQYPGHFLHFALGITLANFYVRWQLQPRSGRLFRALTSPQAGTAYFFAGCLVVLYSMNKVSWYASQVGFDFARYVSDPKGWVPYYFHGIPFAIGFTLMMAGLLFGARWLQNVFSVTPLRLIGVLGYSIYLWHVAVITVIGHLPFFATLTPAHRFPALLAAAAAVLLVWSSATYLAVEKPFMVFGRSRGASRPAVLSPQAFDGAVRAPAEAAPARERGLLRYFALPSSSGDKVPYLDGIRAVAVIFVVVTHVWALTGGGAITIGNAFGGTPIQLTPYLSTMHVGVDLFFVLSGFLLAQRWLRADFEHRPRPRMGTYFRHRFFRIVPAYYVCLFVMLIFLTPYLILPWFVYSRLGAFLLGAHLTFTHYLFPLSAGDYNINGSFWTLTMEMIFYLILPWAVRLFLRNRWLVTLPVLALCTVGWRYLSAHSLGPLVDYYQGTVAAYGVDTATIRGFLARQFPAYFVDFGGGIVVANLYWQYKTGAKAYRVLRYLTVQWMGTLYFFLGWAIVLASMNRLALRPFWISPYLSNIVIGVGFALILAGILAGGEWLQTVFSIAPLRFIGIIGYSVFLWHMPLIYLFNKYPAIAALPPEQRFGRVLLLTSGAALILGTLSYLAVEKPFILLGRGRPVAEPAQAPRPVGEIAAPRISERDAVPAG